MVHHKKCRMPFCTVKEHLLESLIINNIITNSIPSTMARPIVNKWKKTAIFPRILNLPKITGNAALKPPLMMTHTESQTRAPARAVRCRWSAVVVARPRGLITTIMFPRICLELSPVISQLFFSLGAIVHIRCFAVQCSVL